MVGFVCVLAGASAAEAGLPAYFRNHDVATVAGSRAVDRDGFVRLQVRGREHSFDLELAPSPVLAPGAVTVTIDADGEHHEMSRSVLYRGHLAGDPESSVRVALTEHSMIGSVTAGGRTWFLEPMRRFEKGARTGDTLVYEAGDIDPSAMPPASCGVEAGPAAAAQAGALALLTDDEPAAATSSAAEAVELTLVADYRFYQTHGSDSAAYMQSIIDQVAAFYPSSINVTASVLKTVIYSSPGVEPLSTSTASQTLLASLAQARANYASLLGTGDITHLFTGRDLDSSVIGIAYLGTVCDRYYAASVAQDFSSNLHMMTLLTGHELGHSLGAHHDGQTGSPCSSAAYGYVMWPSLSGSLAEQFSTCSQASVKPVVDSASCITTVTSTSCGNGVVDTGEQCDDGAVVGANCCRGDCRYETAGVACTADANQCTGDICNSTGACIHPNTASPCDDGNACSASGQCSAGFCTASTEFQPMHEPRLRVRLDGGDKDSLFFAGFLDASFTSLPTRSGAVVRFLDGAGGLLRETVVAPAGFADRSGTGASFVYDAGPQATGLTSLRVRYKRAASLAKVRLRFEDTDLTFLQGRDDVIVQVLIGDAVTGDCGSALTMTCDVSESRLSCS